MPNLTVPVTENDHILGSIEAPLTLLEYGDYQCALCKLANPVLKQIKKEMGDQMRFVFRNFPLQTSHPDAFMAATAAEAAGMQQKFWEMHDYLYEHQKELSPENLIAFAEALKLNLEQFKEDLKSEFISKKLEEDFRGGVRSGVNGTPCFFINGERYDGGLSYDELLSTLKQKLTST
ncbi:DsbA family protein [Candidatus Protochlamydia phocaeensis]|uniref:DsbA family protein n=1 Tax=Candidatus Protochlamydia phocaeensis TaxID=1414722 RepID=UPI0008399FCF|nr:thioredoxin domain-containing protein [Candidatus Protochlamydia phocaeensis]